eukprot:TRINITY_DN34388_c0_g1_i1.p1 TRINITY_DN34388_c0_g1~~TRINITY_DN34388_c0_g1_i1.p1  ORF type:complete len:400 (+),score=59.25 TRINITY_DN34388_c0_g1_i1:56-1255(+)
MNLMSIDGERTHMDWAKMAVKVLGLCWLLRKGMRGFKKPTVGDKVKYDDATKPGVTGVLLVNLGTPAALNVGSVRAFLREFLSDERVIDSPPYIRWMLVNCIIAPFRAAGSTEMYSRIWDPALKHTNRGSPLVRYGFEMLDKLQADLDKKSPGKYHLELAMRYQNPDIETGLLNLKRKCVEHIIVVPLFPQYSSSCTGSIHQKVFEILGRWDRIPNLTFKSALIDDPNFLKGFEENAKQFMDNEYDHYLFSYHGVPETQITKGSFECKLDNNCCSSLTERNKGCYRAQCYETSRRIAAGLGIAKDKFSTSFQSRLGPTKWLSPYTDEVVDSFPAANKKRILVFSPAFVADCLETVDEIGSEIKHSFLKNGGETLDLVPSLNATPAFISTMADLIQRVKA